MTAPPDSLKGWERWLGHVGYVAEGLIYLLLGLYALAAGLERRRQPNGSFGALTQLGATPLGKALLALLTLGLAAFALWQLLLAIRDPEHRRNRRSLPRLLVRLGHLFSGVLYGVILGRAIWSLFGFAKDTGDGPSQAQWTTWVVRFPFGRFVAALVGIGIAVFGCFQFYRAVTADKTKRLDLTRTRLRILIEVLGIYGLISRGILFTLVGLYLVAAAWRLDARYSGGISGALATLQQGAYGTWLLGTVAVGLVCFGLFQIIKERYRRFRDS